MPVIFKLKICYSNQIIKHFFIKSDYFRFIPNQLRVFTTLYINELVTLLKYQFLKYIIMKEIFTIIIFVFVVGKSQAQTQWNIVPTPNDTITTHYGHFLNVIDSLTVILTPRYTYDSQDLIKTSDGGLSWSSYTIDSTMYTILHESDFIDANVGFIVGGTDFGNWNVLLKTSNGGANWQNIDTSFFTTTYPNSITEVAFVTDQIGFIARNEENKIYRTINGGTNFTALDLPQIPNGLYSFITEMRFINPYIGFVCRVQTGNHTTGTIEILKTTDGGASWNITNVTNWQNINIWNKKDKIQFVNNLQGFAIVGEGTLKVTQDGGNSWADYNLPLATPPATDFYFVNNACGYVALAGNIYRTNDAGQSWSLQTIENNLQEVRSITFATENFGYALNESIVPGQKTTTLLNTNQQPAAPLSSTSFEKSLEFTIYPNPAEDLIQLQNTNNVDINFIHLIDASGKILKTYKDNFTQLNVSNCSSGVYLLFIQTSNQKVFKKIIIK